MKQLVDKLDDLFIEALQIKDFAQTICDALQHNADEVQDGTHVLSAVNILVREFEKMVESIENLSRTVLNKTMIRK